MLAIRLVGLSAPLHVPSRAWGVWVLDGQSGLLGRGFWQGDSRSWRCRPAGRVEQRQPRSVAGLVVQPVSGTSVGAGTLGDFRRRYRSVLLDSQPDVWAGMFVEDAYGVLVVLRVAQSVQPVGNDVPRQHHPGDVADDVLAEGDGLDSRRLVGLHRQDVVVRGYPQGLQLRPSPFLEDYLLEVGGNAFPLARR